MDPKWCLFFFVVIVSQFDALDPRLDAANHLGKSYNANDVRTLARMSDSKHFEEVLDKILIPRVVGTPTHKKVKDYLKSTMLDLGWTVTTDRFLDWTPLFGNLEFENIIATLNPSAHRYLVLACHYDSKWFKEDNFVAAVDSAVPCAMMINLAQTLKPLLDAHKFDDELSLQFLFLDGEEAFKEWTDTDSLYGARHLAAEWEKTPHPTSRSNNSKLHSIDLFVLLDLLGDTAPVFHSYFENTDRWHQLLVGIESAMKKMGVMDQYAKGSGQTYFKPESSRAAISDDHLPFLHRGVPCLHLIPSPFPKVWHTPDDTKDNLDMPTIKNLNKILRVFVSSYLRLCLHEGGCEAESSQEEIRTEL